MFFNLYLPLKIRLSSAGVKIKNLGWFTPSIQYTLIILSDSIDTKVCISFTSEKFKSPEYKVKHCTLYSVGHNCKI